MARITIIFDVPDEVDVEFRSGTMAAVVPLSHKAAAEGNHGR